MTVFGFTFKKTNGNEKRKKIEKEVQRTNLQLYRLLYIFDNILYRIHYWRIAYIIFMYYFWSMWGKRL